ncbi:MAG: hypothetical protein JST54_26265 [Deltaproteobacteria bacterium]|nr:hypothetical protein [Deltaproteobacteria bacterium]
MKAKMLASVVGALLMAGATSALADPSDTNDINNTGSQDMNQGNAGQGMSGSEQDQTGANTNLQQKNIKNAHAESAKGMLMRTDNDAHTLTLTIPAGKTTTIEKAGNVTSIDQTKHLVTLSLPVAQDAKVLRNGKSSSLTALQPGDEIRVKYDPKLNAITNISATPMKGHAGHQGAMQPEQPAGTTSPDMTNPGTPEGAGGGANTPPGSNTNPSNP